MFTTLDTFHFRDAALKHVAQRNISVMVTTLDTSHFEMSRLNDVAPRNMLLMSFTLDTSHLEMSHLNNLAQETIRYISCTLDTSHSVIGTCGPLEQSPFGESLMHALTALLTCTLDKSAVSESAVSERLTWYINCNCLFPNSDLNLFVLVCKPMSVLRSPKLI